jgi:TolB protein
MMHRRFSARLWALPLLLGAAVALAPMAAMAQAVSDEVNVDKYHRQPIPIALPDFPGTTPAENELGHNIMSVVSGDLERSGLFRPIDPKSFVQDAQSLRVTPRFADWKLINAQDLVTGALATQADGSVHIEFRLWDVLAGTQTTGFAFTIDRGHWRRIAHIIADEIYKRVIGEDGYFDSRVVFIAESGPAQQRVKRLAIMDQDGADFKTLTDGRALVLTPRFSPTPGSQEITYLSYANNTPRVYLFDIETGHQEILGEFPGMTFAPRFSPDGNKVVFSLSINGASQLYVMDLRTRKPTQLTSTAAIDTSPCYSPDGKYITFNSDRGGTQQLYVMNADGSDIKRISFGAGRYATPVWSPRGDLIAFTKFEGQNFSIGVMKPDGSGERILTNGFLVEGPTWAPNGRVLMFFRQGGPDGKGRGGSTRLYSIDLLGTNEREVPTPQDASDPAWSPLLPR